MIIKIKYMLLIALAALVSCSSDDFVGDQTLRESNENAAISFNLNVPSVTRADATGATAAEHLSNQFIVWGEKNEINAGETGANVGTAAGTTGREGHLVFKNYLVDWVNNSAYITTSNTKGWEYVGLKLNDGDASPQTTNYINYIHDNSGGGEQTIKYWDYGASSYTFTAVSALPADITAGNVTITKTQTGSTVYDKGYTVALTAGSHLDNLYFSERQSITQSANTDRTQANKYGGNVTFRFHNVVSKVRVAMYETIPGYTVTINKFSVDNDGADPAFSEMTDVVTDNFAANFKNYTSGIAGTVNVTYVASGTNQNYPIVSFTPTSGTMADVLALGAGLKEGITIGETATGATYDKAEKAYTRVYPNEGNTQNLKLKLSYTLTAPVTGETIVINDKTAEVPSQYLQWKSGYAYTYLFKITDDDLYPITFDAVEIAGEDGAAEYITIVNEPSITTFGVVVNSSDEFQAYQTDKNEYQVPSGSDKLDIYATFLQDGSVLIPQLTEATKTNFVTVYVVDYKDGATEAEKAEKPITELSVANAIEHTGGIITATKITSSNVSTYFASDPTPVASVPVEDGTTKTIDALKLTGVKTAGKYAVEIITYKKLATKLTSEQSKVGYYAESSGTYTKQTEGVGDGSTDYYEQIKTYKVIKVEAAP